MAIVARRGVCAESERVRLLVWLGNNTPRPYPTLCAGLGGALQGEGEVGDEGDDRGVCVGNPQQREGTVGWPDLCGPLAAGTLRFLFWSVGCATRGAACIAGVDDQRPAR